MKYICKKCEKIIKKSESVNHKCDNCGSELNYLGKCGECLNFEEFYSGIGTCDYKKHIRRETEGCKNFV
jgi:predicted amidophosphoribosyltransferase